MAEQDRVSPRVPTVPGAPAEFRRPRRLPAVVRYLVAAVLGGTAAALVSYLIRSIGF